VTSEAVAVRDMTLDQFVDFTNWMRLLVAEQAGLWEFPKGGIELAGGRAVQHGPWRQQDCCAALLIWLDAGLITACRVRPGGSEPDLPYEDARADLLNADMWRPPDGSGFVRPVPCWLLREPGQVDECRARSCSLRTCRRYWPRKRRRAVSRRT
jgi:hypothetical protein